MSPPQGHLQCRPHPGSHLSFHPPHRAYNTLRLTPTPPTPRLPFGLDLSHDPDPGAALNRPVPSLPHSVPSTPDTSPARPGREAGDTALDLSNLASPGSARPAPTPPGAAGRPRPSCPEPRDVREGPPGAHGRRHGQRTAPSPPGTSPAPLRPPPRSRPEHLPRRPGTFRSISRAAHGQVPAPSHPGPSSAAEPGRLRPSPGPRAGPAPACCKPRSRALPRGPTARRAQPRPPLTRDPIAAKGQRLLPRRPRNQPLSRWGAWPDAGPRPLFGQ